VILDQQQYFSFKISKLWIYCNLCDHINTNASNWLAKCHFFTVAGFALANRSLPQLCCPSVWIQLSLSECTSFCKGWVWFFVLLLKDKIFSCNCWFIFCFLLYFHSDSFYRMLCKHKWGILQVWNRVPFIAHPFNLKAHTNKSNKSIGS